MDQYSTLVRIISTNTMLIALFPCILVVILSNKVKQDSKNYVLLLQIRSFYDCLLLIIGWIITNRWASRGEDYDSRHIMIDPGVVFVCYGVAGYLGPGVCHLFDGLIAPFICFSPSMVVLMMAFRVCMLFDMQLTRKHIIVATSLIYLFASSVSLVIWSSRSSVKDFYFGMDNATKREVQTMPTYAIKPPNWEMKLLIVLTMTPIFSVPATLALVFVMYRKLCQNLRHVSAKTRKLHSVFMKLLTLESLIVMFYMMITSTLQQPEMFGNLSNFASLFNNSFFALCPGLQGSFTLYLIPYLNEGFKKAFAPFFSKVVKLQPANPTKNSNPA